MQYIRRLTSIIVFGLVAIAATSLTASAETFQELRVGLEALSSRHHRLSLRDRRQHRGVLPSLRLFELSTHEIVVVTADRFGRELSRTLVL